MTPMVVFDTFGIISEKTGGHVPTAYLIALVGIIFTAASYGKVVRVFPEAGSAYTYTRKAINGHLGFLVGWTSLLDYLFLPMVNALLCKIYFSVLFPNLPSWIWVILFVGTVTLLNLTHVNTLANFNAFFVLIQVAIMAVFIVLVIKELLNGEGTGEIFSIQPFLNEGIHFSTLVTGASLVCFSFLGFDAVTTLSEETKDAKKTISKAIL